MRSPSQPSATIAFVFSLTSYEEEEGEEDEDGGSEEELRSDTILGNFVCFGLWSRERREREREWLRGKDREKEVEGQAKGEEEKFQVGEQRPGERHEVLRAGIDYLVSHKIHLTVMPVNL